MAIDGAHPLFTDEAIWAGDLRVTASPCRVWKLLLVRFIELLDELALFTIDRIWSCLLVDELDVDFMLELVGLHVGIVGFVFDLCQLCVVSDAASALAVSTRRAASAWGARRLIAAGRHDESKGTEANKAEDSHADLDGPTLDCAFQAGSA
jgi:hypothetical protein